MNIFNLLFRKKNNRDIPPMLSWEFIVKKMRDRDLDAFACEVVDIIYSKDCSMRYVILKEENGLFSYQLEAIYQYHEDEWQYICSNDNTLAMWEPFRGILGSPSFESINELFLNLKAEPEYKQYF